MVLLCSEWCRDSLAPGSSVSPINGRVSQIVTSQARADKSLILKNCFDSQQKVVSGIRLDYIAASTSFQSFFHNVERAVFAHEKEFGLWGNLSDSVSRLNPIQVGEANIQYYQVWLQFLRLLKGVKPITRLSHET